VLALFVELILQLEARVVGFHGADCLHQSIDPPIHLKLSQLLGCGGAVAGIVVGKARVPPDAGVDIFGKILTMLVGAGFARGAIDVDVSGRAIIIFEVSLSPACMSMVVFFAGPPDDGVRSSKT
jgi:hypothetical protein